jgi:hypothetical protein
MRINLARRGSISYGPSDWISVSPGGSGVYVYINSSGVALYVGKCLDLSKRIQSHHVLNRAILRRICRGDGALYLYPCSDPLMSCLEGFLIFTFQPHLNRVMPSIIYDFETECDQALRELKELCHAYNV